MDFGNRIRTARKAAGLSQEAVARRAGLSLKGMSEIERGDIEDPHFSSLMKIAHALGLPVEQLLKEEEPALAGKADAPREAGPQVVTGEVDLRGQGTLTAAGEVIKAIKEIADEYAGGEISSEEFAERVLGELERVA